MYKTAKQPTIDRELVFQLVSQKKWEQIIEVFKNNLNYDFIYADPILKSFIDQYFIDELLTKSSLKEDPAYKYYLQNFYMLHDQDKFSFALSKDNYKKLIIKIVEVESELARAYEYACMFPDEEICSRIIQEYEASLPKIVAHTQQAEIHVTENKEVSLVDASISLFKSNQEYLFYRAVREVFPMFLVIPNVALTAIIDYDSIKGTLTKDEQRYFFSALIDSVVIDTENNYKPIRFIELDSPYHDNVQQQQKDLLKDQILAKAGQKLLRVRRLTTKHDEKDFLKLIREVIH
jgi:hypothetical protein